MLKLILDSHVLLLVSELDLLSVAEAPQHLLLQLFKPAMLPEDLLNLVILLIMAAVYVPSEHVPESAHLTLNDALCVRLLRETADDRIRVLVQNRRVAEDQFLLDVEEPRIILNERV